MEKYINKRTNQNKQKKKKNYVHDKIHQNKSALSSTFSFKGILDPVITDPSSCL